MLHSTRPGMEVQHWLSVEPMHCMTSCRSSIPSQQVCDGPACASAVWRHAAEHGLVQGHSLGPCQNGRCKDRKVAHSSNGSCAEVGRSSCALCSHTATRRQLAAHLRCQSGWSCAWEQVPAPHHPHQPPGVQFETQRPPAQTATPPALSHCLPHSAPTAGKTEAVRGPAGCAGHKGQLDPLLRQRAAPQQLKVLQDGCAAHQQPFAGKA